MMQQLDLASDLLSARVSNDSDARTDAHPFAVTEMIVRSARGSRVVDYRSQLTDAEILLECE